MATITAVQGTRTSLTTSAMDSLASATYVSAGVIDLTSADPLECFIEVKVTPSTVPGNKQVVVFAQGSLDGTNFESGPVSGTTATDEPNLTFVGTVPCNTASTAQTGIFALSGPFGGALPAHVKIIIKNDTGAALASSGHHVYYAEVTGASA